MTINLTVGENGIITRAERARDEMIRAQREEELQMSYLGTMIDVYSSSSGSTEEDILKTLTELTKMLSMQGLYRLDMLIDANTRVTSLNFDCVRNQDDKLYREFVEVIIEIGESSVGIKDLNIKSSKEVKSIDNEAQLLPIIFNSMTSGKIPEDIVVISDSLYEYKGEIYQLVQNMDQSAMQVSMYMEKYKNSSRIKLKDAVSGGTYVIGLGIDGNLYYWDRENMDKVPVASTKIKKIDFDASSIERIDEGILIDEKANAIYRIINPEQYDTISFEKTVLNEKCIPKSFSSRFILSTDGKLWDYEGNCYNELIQELNNVQFTTLNASTFLNECILIDTNKNVWYTNDDEFTCLNNMENSPIQGMNIIKTENNYILTETGKIYEYNGHNFKELNINKNATNIYALTYDLIIEDEENQFWYYYKSQEELKLIETNGNTIKNTFNNCVLYENGDLVGIEHNGDMIETVPIFFNIENKEIIECSINGSAIILIDNEYNAYEIGSFIVPI